jgi:hypothetical protein
LQGLGAQPQVEEVAGGGQDRVDDVAGYAIIGESFGKLSKMKP